MSRHLQVQWSDVVPRRTIGWEDGPDGGAVLLVPRFRRGPLARWLQPRLKRPYIRVKLDEIGSFAWRKMDGSTSFASIVEAMKKEFQDRVNPAEDRLSKFLTILYRNKFVQLYKPSGEFPE